MCIMVPIFENRGTGAFFSLWAVAADATAQSEKNAPVPLFSQNGAAAHGHDPV